MSNHDTLRAALAALDRLVDEAKSDSPVSRIDVFSDAETIRAALSAPAASAAATVKESLTDGAPVAEAREGVAIYLVASGDASEGGRELYERHEGGPPPLCDYEGPLFAAPAAAGSAEPAQPATQEAGAVAPDVRIYWHASRGWQVEWLTAAPNGGQSNYYHAAPQAPAAPAAPVWMRLTVFEASKLAADHFSEGRFSLIKEVESALAAKNGATLTTQETP